MSYVINREVARQPIENVRPQPADLASVKSPLFWEASQHHQAGKNPPGPARQPGDVVGAEEVLKRRERFIDPG